MFLINKNFWEVKKTQKKGLGVFAKKKIKAGTVIGDYLGKVIKITDYDFDRDKAGLYVMFYTDDALIFPDLAKPGIHLLNHSCNPNCFISVYQSHTLFFALRDINPHEELTISYQLAPKENCNPCTHICKCESKNCTGSMHLTEEKYQAWQKFQDEQKKNMAKPKVVFNKSLPRLKNYPKLLPLFSGSGP